MCLPFSRHPGKMKGILLWGQGVLFGSRISGDCSDDDDDDEVEVDFVLAVDGGTSLNPFHFPEIRHGKQFSRSPDIPILLFGLTSHIARRNGTMH
jgi:hypothetical protein